MILCNCLLHLELLHVSSLKGRRAVINALKEKLKQFNLIEKMDERYFGGYSFELEEL